MSPANLCVVAQTGYVVGRERASSRMLQYIVSILQVLIIIRRGYVKCNIIHKRDGLVLIICVCCSWEKALNVGLVALFDI
jgi:hypothetical protein